MSINPSKCSFINIHKPNTFSSKVQYKIDENPLSEVSCCKYLGLWIDSHLSLKTHILKTKNKIEQHLYHLYYLQKSGLKLYPKTILQIYKSKSRPCIEYASIYYFHKDNNNTLQILQNKFIRAAHPCRKSTPIHTLQMITNIKPLQVRIHNLTLRHWFRAKYSSDFHPLNKTIKQYCKKIKPHSPKMQLSFDIANKILNLNTTNITVSNQIQPPQSPISALPIYNIHIIPLNYRIKSNLSNNILAKDYNFYTDGSCTPNPAREPTVSTPLTIMGSPTKK